MQTIQRNIMEPEIIRNDTPQAILLRNHTRIALLQFLLVAQSAQADEGRNLVFFTPLTSWIIKIFFFFSIDHLTMNFFIFNSWPNKQPVIKGLAYSN